MDKRISACFDHMNYHFYEKRFDKDLKENREIMFLVEGTIAVYALLDSGEIRFVSYDDSFTMLGDVEFVVGGTPIFFVEAKTKVKMICLNLEEEGEKLHQDITFMHTVMKYLADKVTNQGKNEFIMPSIEERLLVLMEQDIMVGNISLVSK